MRVSELRLLLKMLPDDMPVLITSNFCCHVEVAERSRKNTYQWVTGHSMEPSLILRGNKLWYEDEPNWQFRGPWRLSKLTDGERAEILDEVIA